MGKRYKNQGTFAGAWEIQAQRPLDDRVSVENEESLTIVDTWKGKDGNYYHYNGMIVSIADTGKIAIYIGETGNITDVADSNKWKIYSADVVHKEGEESIDGKKIWQGIQEYNKLLTLINESGIKFNNTDKADKIIFSDGKTLQEILNGFVTLITDQTITGNKVFNNIEVKDRMSVNKLKSETFDIEDIFCKTITLYAGDERTEELKSPHSTDFSFITRGHNEPNTTNPKTTLQDVISDIYDKITKSSGSELTINLDEIGEYDPEDMFDKISKLNNKVNVTFIASDGEQYIHPISYIHNTEGEEYFIYGLRTAVATTDYDGAICLEEYPMGIMFYRNRIVPLFPKQTIWKGTQEEYDSITTKDPDKVYLIFE